MNLRTICLSAALLLLACIVSPNCNGQLLPEEVAIIAAKGSRGSEGLASYYAEKRGIPAENILLVTLPPGETLDRNTWNSDVRPAIRNWLLEDGRHDRIRCLTTTWDVPLKIAPAANQDDLKEYREFLKAEQATRLRLLQETIDSVELLAKDFAEEADAEIGPGAGEQSSAYERFKARIETSMRAAQARINRQTSTEEKNRELQQLQTLFMTAAGLGALNNNMVQQLQALPNGNDRLKSQIEQLGGRLAAYAELRGLLEQMPYGVERDALMLFLLSRTTGVLGSIEWLNEQIVTLEKNETGASFDSELSLVLWPDDYQLLRYQPNYLRSAFNNSALRDRHATMMVARLDAPTLTLAKGLVDMAIDVEQNGLQGKIYLDSRGIGTLQQTAVQQGSYADFDRALLLAAQNLRQKSQLEVVTEETPKLFQAGDCPDAAIYCGWYSLAKYVDAFDWSPGAVAYHMASAEAKTLRDKDSQVWCKRMLEDGVAATIGPVYEPYLIAFPRPNEFFDLLVEGELTLVECYYHTKPFNSWMMTLIGDPLYRPFANK